MGCHIWLDQFVAKIEQFDVIFTLFCEEKLIAGIKDQVEDACEDSNKIFSLTFAIIFLNAKTFLEKFIYSKGEERFKSFICV